MDDFSVDYQILFQNSYRAVRTPLVFNCAHATIDSELIIVEDSGSSKDYKLWRFYATI